MDSIIGSCKERNMNSKVAVKTAKRNTRLMINNEVIMQGTVWGILFCTVTMDKLGKQVNSIS